MKKILIILTTVFCWTTYSQTKPMKLPEAVFTSFTQDKSKLVKEIKTHLKDGTLPVHLGQKQWMASNAALHNKTTDQLLTTLLSDRARIESHYVYNYGWNGKKYVPLEFTGELVPCYSVDGVPYIKVSSLQKINGQTQPCLNFVKPYKAPAVKPDDGYTEKKEYELKPRNVIKVDDNQYVAPRNNTYIQEDKLVLLPFPETSDVSGLTIVQPSDTFISINNVTTKNIVNNRGTVRNVRPNPPTSSCPPGQYLHTYPDGSTQCLSYNTSGVGTNPGTSNGNTSGIGTNPGTGDGSNDSTPPGNSSGNGTDPGARIRKI